MQKVRDQERADLGLILVPFLAPKQSGQGSRCGKVRFLGRFERGYNFR
jgi:hypothetical protein